MSMLPQNTNHPSYGQANLAANATTLLKSAAGILHTITINTKGATGNTLTVYDNTSAAGTKIATIDTTANTGTFEFDCYLTTGLTAVLATGTSADVTFTFV